MLNNKNAEYLVPKSFLIQPFFDIDSTFAVFQDGLEFATIIKKEPLYYDMLQVIKGQLVEEPWRNLDKTIPIILKQWKELKPEVYEGYKERGGTHNKRVIIQCLSLFIVCLFWMNESSVPTLNVKNMRISELQITPINCEERLTFVLSNPMKYHSFVQLDQLFAELEKSYFKNQAIKKLKRDYSS